MKRAVLTATMAATVIVGIALALMLPPSVPPSCEGDEVAVRDPHNGSQWWCAKARRMAR